MGPKLLSVAAAGPDLQRRDPRFAALDRREDVLAEPEEEPRFAPSHPQAAPPPVPDELPLGAMFEAALVASTLPRPPPGSYGDPTTWDAPPGTLHLRDVLT